MREYQHGILLDAPEQGPVIEYIGERADPTAEWVSKALTKAHAAVLVEVMLRKVAGTLQELDRADVDALFLKVRAEMLPSEEKPKEAHRVITSVPLNGVKE